jgi:hypothetical protein
MCLIDPPWPHKVYLNTIIEPYFIAGHGEENNLLDSGRILAECPTLKTTLINLHPCVLFNTVYDSFIT